MNYKVGDKVKYRPNWDLSNKYHVGVVKSIKNDNLIEVIVSFPKNWLILYSYVSEVSLLSPVEALLYDWNEKL